MKQTAHYSTTAEDRIPLKQKSAYAVGMFVNNLQAAALPAMVVILNLGLGMDVLWVGIIGAIPRIFDAVSDPMLGYLSDNTRTRWGRRRPFILVGALLAGVIFALMWQLPAGYINLFSDKTTVEYNAPSSSITIYEGREVVIDGKKVVRGQIGIHYNSEQPSECGVVLYGPKALMSKTKLSQAIDLSEYASVELEADVPEGLSLDIIVNAAGDGGESFHINATSNEFKDGILKFNFSDLEPYDLSGSQNGGNEPDLHAIKNIVVRVAEAEKSGTVTIDSFKLHKAPAILNRDKNVFEKVAGIFQEEVAVVDILAETPLSQHESLNPNDTVILYKNGGGVALQYHADETSDARFVFYGPQLRAVANEQVYATDLDGFPQMEINTNVPKNQSFAVVFNEAGTVDALGNDQGAYSINLLSDKLNAEKEKKNLYQFALSDLHQDDSSEKQDSSHRLNTQAINNVTLIFPELEDSGTITVDSIKLKKAESFFVRYFWYFLTMSILFFLAYTVYATPFVAFGYEMTPDYHERTRLHTFANTIGQIPWLGVAWFYAIMSSGLFRDTVHGARSLAIVVGFMVGLLGIVPAIFCRERQTLTPAAKSDKGFWKNMGEFFKGVEITFKCKPFVKLCGATFLVFNGFQLGMSFSIYVMIYYLFGGNDANAGKLLGWFGMLTAIATLGVIQLTGWIATRIGKRKTFLITISLSIIGYALKWVGYNPEHPYWLLFSTPLVAFGTGSLFTLMGSMISDVCDYDELATKQRREGVFGAIYWWMVKVGMALAGLLTGVMLKVSGFDVALGAGQSEKTLFLLRVFDVGVPIFTSAIALFIIATYKITEQKAHEIRVELENRRGKVTAAETNE